MLPAALNVLDRFHIAKKLGEAVDDVRRQEVTKLRDLLKYDLKAVRAFGLKESFDAFWQYESPRWARWFLKKWCLRINLCMRKADG